MVRGFTQLTMADILQPRNTIIMGSRVDEDVTILIIKHTEYKDIHLGNGAIKHIPGLTNTEVTFYVDEHEYLLTGHKPIDEKLLESWIGKHDRRIARIIYKNLLDNDYHLQKNSP